MMNKGSNLKESLKRVKAWRLSNPDKYKEQKHRANHSETRKKWVAANRQRLSRLQKDYVTRNRERVLKSKRNNNLLRKYGVSADWYAEQLAAQAGGCAICGRATKKPLSVDHNHETGKVRALLCVVCNTKLGVLEDNTFKIKAAIYLEMYD